MAAAHSPLKEQSPCALHPDRADPAAGSSAHKSDGSTALHIAAASLHDEATSQLLKAKANADAHRSDHHTPMTIAASNGYESILGLLLDGGASVDVVAAGDNFVFRHRRAILDALDAEAAAIDRRLLFPAAAEYGDNGNDENENK